MSGPYENTGVPVSQSKGDIEKLLKNRGARGMQLESSWGDDGATETCRVRFAWPLTGDVMQTVRLEVQPLPPVRPKRANAKGITAEQRERQAWRGLFWYLKSMMEAAEFGLLKFEDVFMSFFESADGRTIGEVVLPQLEAGRLALPRGDS